MQGGRLLLEPGVLPRVALYLAAQLASATLAAYGFVRGDKRSNRLSLMLCLLGLHLVMLARMMTLVPFTDAQVRFYAGLALAGLAVAAVGGGGFALHLARRRGLPRSGWIGFTLALAASLSLQPVLALGTVDRVVPAAPALAVLGLAAWMLARRRLLFPGLDRMVLEASVAESGGGILVFAADGRLIDTGSRRLAALLALDSRETLEGFIDKVRGRLVSGRFFTAAEVAGFDAGTPGREIALDVPGRSAHFLVFANPLREAPGPRLGVVFGFFDISRQKRIEAELDASNAELDAKHAQLKSYLAVAGELEEERERRRVAEKIHRTLDLQIAGLLAQMRGGDGVPPAGLEDILAGCRHLLGEIRSTVRSLDPDRGREGGAP